jgi:hypothetical protein
MCRKLLQQAYAKRNHEKITGSKERRQEDLEKYRQWRKDWDTKNPGATTGPYRRFQVLNAICFE